MTPSFKTSLIFVAFLPQGALADNWPQFRGPSHNGSAMESDLPTTFSKEQNVKWVASMKGPAASTPIVWDDRVFVSTADESAETLLEQCYCLIACRWRRENRVLNRSPIALTRIDPGVLRSIDPPTL